MNNVIKSQVLSLKKGFLGEAFMPGKAGQKEFEYLSLLSPRQVAGARGFYGKIVYFLQNPRRGNICMDH